jgi:hypothetical protein
MAIFGAPGVDLGSYAKVFDSYISWSRSYHYIVDTDPVPLLPPLASKPPARVWELSRSIPLSNNPLQEAHNRFLAHEPKEYYQQMEARCAESTEQMTRNFYDCFVAKVGRVPTEKEFQEWQRTLYTDKVEKTCRLATQVAIDHHKLVRELFQFKLNRAPTDAEIKQYSAIIADTPRSSQGMSNALKTLEASPAYAEWLRDNR